MTDPAAQREAVAKLMGVASGYWLSQALYVAVELGVADLLKDGPRSSADLAAAAGAHADTLHRILRALAGSGIFAQNERGDFELTPLAEPLLSDAPAPVGPFIRMLGSEWHWRAWGAMIHCAKTGEPGFDHVFGAPMFEAFAKHPKEARIFSEAMTSRSAAEDKAIASALDLRGAKAVADVGGGQGALLRAILEARPEARGILFELPQVVEMARPIFAETKVGDRCQFVGGSFFDPIPVRADICLMKRIIHDWDDERSRTIIRNCRDIVEPDGRLVLLEFLLPPPGNEFSRAKLIDLNMLAMTVGGRERSEAEYAALFATAGFKLAEVIPTVADMYMIIAVPA